METIKGVITEGLKTGIVESFNPMELDKYHTRMIEELAVLKVMISRLENTVKIIEKTVNPLYDTYNICSVAEAKYVLKLVKKRLNEYSKHRKRDNWFRVAWPKYYLEDIGRDINLLQITLESMNTELHIFDILQNQDGRLSASKKRNIREICESNFTPLNDVKLDIQTAFKVMDVVTTKGKKAVQNAVKATLPKRDIKKELKANRKPVVKVRKTKSHSKSRSSGKNTTRRLYPNVQPPVTTL